MSWDPIGTVSMLVRLQAMAEEAWPQWLPCRPCVRGAPCHHSSGTCVSTSARLFWIFQPLCPNRTSPLASSLALCAFRADLGSFTHRLYASPCANALLHAHSLERGVVLLGFLLCVLMIIKRRPASLRENSNRLGLEQSAKENWIAGIPVDDRWPTL